jgi:hypothetical protein
MTAQHLAAPVAGPNETRILLTRPPLSRAAQLAVAASLLLAGLLNGGTQFVGHLVIGDRDFSDQIRWGAEHPVFHGVEQFALLASMLFLPIAVLGLAQVTRHRAPRLTAVGIVLTVWGFWGFHNVVALGYTAGTIAPSALGVDSAVRLNESFLEHPGSVFGRLAGEQPAADPAGPAGGVPALGLPPAAGRAVGGAPAAAGLLRVARSARGADVVAGVERDGAAGNILTP